MKIHLTGICFRPDNRRVVVRPFIPVEAADVENIIDRALSLTEIEAEEQVTLLRADFGKRHVGLDKCWQQHFERVRAYIPSDRKLSETRQLFVGAIFSGEYALESAALFNPSIVPHPDQSNLNEGTLRFILSLRATGEGHVSSIEFRAGVIRSDHSIEMEKTTPFVTLPEVDPRPTFQKAAFVHKLNAMGVENEWSAEVMRQLPDPFTRDELEKQLSKTDDAVENSHEAHRTIECMHWLAESNYEIHFNSSTTVSERIIFPVSANESNGIEDARFVRFVDDDGSVTYYATYTAYNGRVILPQLIETTNFLHFRVRTLNGGAVQNKGMALFPRRIGGRYAMLSRQDDENLFLMFSDSLYLWSDPRILDRPEQPWEFVKIGNCGSPIETEAGWLVLTHGVGPMRKYCIGAMLLDLNDPTKVIGQLDQPLLKPKDEEREGYVPNVVYSCGALVHRGRLILPYGLSDSAAAIVTIELSDLLSALRRS